MCNRSGNERPNLPPPYLSCDLYSRKIVANGHIDRLMKWYFVSMPTQINLYE